MLPQENIIFIRALFLTTVSTSLVMISGFCVWAASYLPTKQPVLGHPHAIIKHPLCVCAVKEQTVSCAYDSGNVCTRTYNIDCTIEIS